MKKEYRCCICKKETKYKPIRIVLQKHDNKETYGRYHNIKNYDFCKKCFLKLYSWLKSERNLNSDKSYTNGNESIKRN